MLIRQKEVLELLQVPRGTLVKWRKSGHFPEAMQLGPHTIAWKRAEVMAWIDARSAAA